VGSPKSKKEKRRRAARAKRARAQRDRGFWTKKLKVSELLCEFVDPYLDYAETDLQLEALFVIGVLAWNAGIMEMEDGILPDGLIEGLESGGAAQKGFFLELLERKKKDFPDFSQIILNYELTATPSGHHLNVVSVTDHERAGQAAAQGETRAMPAPVLWPPV
jgi:hypothetical protein